MKSFNEDQKFKPKEHETSYLIFERNTDGEEKELEIISNPHALSSEEKFRELSKTCKKLFPGIKFQTKADPKIGLHLINTETNSVIYIKQSK
jgi:hypothetical protein